MFFIFIPITPEKICFSSDPSVLLTSAHHLTSLVSCKTVVTALLTHWSHCSLVLNHRHDAWALCGLIVKMVHCRGQQNRTCVGKVTIQIIPCHVPRSKYNIISITLPWNSSIDTKTDFMEDFVRLGAANSTSHCTYVGPTFSPLPCIKRHFETSYKPFTDYRRPV